MEAAKVLDATGHVSAEAIDLIEAALKDLKTGDILEVQTTVAESTDPLTTWAKEAGHDVLVQTTEGSLFTFWLKKA